MPTKKIKVLEAIRQGKVGGGESHVLELVSHMDREKYEPLVLSFTNGPMVEELEKRGVSTRVLYSERAFDIRVWRYVLELIREEKIDIIHAHGTRAMSNLFWAARKAGLPLIYTVHGWSFHLDQKIIKRKLRELGERFLTRMAGLTICVSEDNRQTGISRVNLKRSTVIYNAINLEKFNPERNDLKNVRAELGIPKEKTVIGYIVRMTVQKDPFTMLKAMKYIRDETDDVILLMVGDGNLKEKAIKMASELKLNSEVIFQPFRLDIPDVLEAIDIYCLPSLWEGFPIATLEAMAMKRAVIVSPVDGSREMIKEGQTGLQIPFREPEKLARALLKLHENKHLREKLAKNGHDYVHANFGIQDQARKIEKIYTEMLQ